ncbi:MAG: glycoside hydrolase family 97 catalytic domain-containing protein [Planctomycetes bacterium]|nr:glycoside hydrolase family 97 catalytic domain-containing protein [Planctomycetota bacterium]
MFYSALIAMGLMIPISAVRAAGSAPLRVKSPDGRLAAAVAAGESGRLEISLSRDGAVLLEPSPLGITVGGVDLGMGAAMGEPARSSVRETYPWRGVHAIAADRHDAARIPMTGGPARTAYALEVRVFDDGLAFRYVVPGEGTRVVSGEATGFRIPAGSGVWFQTNTANYEASYRKTSIEAAPAGEHAGPPVVVELPGGRGYLAITEAGLFRWSGMTLRFEGGASRLLRAAFQDDASWKADGTIETPWRVIMASPDLDGLVNCDIVHDLCPPAAPALARADWIRPGRALWHWWSGKIGNWDSVAYERQRGWVDGAAALGFEYYLVDAGWEQTWGAPGKDMWALLKELCDYARSKGVGIIVWKRWCDGKTEGIEMEGIADRDRRLAFFRRCREAGVAGVKIDYMDSESLDRIGFYTSVLEDAVPFRLMVNFHGANKPTGESRTYPHEITREGIKGLEYNKWSALPPDHYASLPFTRLLAGHGDFTPCTFTASMLKGTTFALQLASAIAFTSPLLHYADRPEVYLASPAVDVIRAIPSTWDETRVLPGSAIGDLAALARRTGDVWFAGIMNGAGERSYGLSLAFLGDGEYRAVLLADDPARPDALVRTEKPVRRGDEIAVRMRAGGGFAAMFVPAAKTGGAIGHWMLDEEAGDGAAADGTGSGLDGRLEGFDPGAEDPRLVPGKIGRALRFFGKGSVRLDPHAGRLGRLTDFTISMWIRYAGGGSRLLFSFSDGTLSHRIQVEVHRDALGFGWQDGGGFRNFMTEPLSWQPERWYHVVFVNDVREGKSILRSNDLARKTDSNTLSPADLRSPVTRVEIGSLCGAYSFNGCVDDVRLYDRALALPEQLALYEAHVAAPVDSKWSAAKEAMLERDRRAQMARRARERFLAEEAPHLPPWERRRKIEWLFQAEDDDLLSRTLEEIAWIRAMIDRLRGRAGNADPSGESAELEALEDRASAAEASLDASDAAATRRLYFDVRALKRRVMFRFPEVDFSEVVCVDAPYTRRSPETHGTFQQTEWVHESRFRSEMCASHGAKLLVLEDLAGTPSARPLAPRDDFGRRVAMFGFDVSFEGDRVLFCMKPEDEKAYHLYEIGIDGDGFRQITSGGYSDIDPVYLPGGGIVFLSTRAEVYAQCGMWARSYILTRCDEDGGNIYILSPGTEPEYSPSLLDDGRILFTRWEYVDKFANRIQSLWTMRTDGTAAAAFWGNQSVIPDHLGEARQIPGTSEVIFSGFGHHDVWVGCIGIVDPTKGLNFPDGIRKVTPELPWPEVGDGPVPTPGPTEAYHTSGRYAAYKTPYPLSRELFLVSARTGAIGVGGMLSAHDPAIGKFKLYLMDIYGNRELLYEGDHNVLYAQPLRPRPRPPILPDLADLPGSERDEPAIRPGILYSSDIFESAPPEVRERGRYLRVVESMPKNYSVGIVHSGGKPFGASGEDSAWGAWGEAFLRGKTPTPATDITWGDYAVYCGPATTLTGPLAVKQVRGTVPIREDGSVRFEAPPCRMLYFQVLDARHRAVHTMRSWVSVRPGEIRGCTGCHEGHASAPVARSAAAGALDVIQPPPWGVRSLSYVKDIQTIFDRACGRCHQGEGEATRALDLTLRPDEKGEARWGGIFPEPYLTLVLGRDNDRIGGACPAFQAAGGYVGVPNTIVTRYDTLPPLTYLSPKAKLIDRAMDRTRCGEDLAPEDLRMLIAWVDLWAMYRSDEECRGIEDAPAEWFPLWSYPPKTKTAPRVRTEYAQDEFRRPEDRVARLARDP